MYQRKKQEALARDNDASRRAGGGGKLLGLFEHPACGSPVALGGGRAKFWCAHSVFAAC